MRTGAMRSCWGFDWRQGNDDAMEGAVEVQAQSQHKWPAGLEASGALAVGFEVEWRARDKGMCGSSCQPQEDHQLRHSAHMLAGLHHAVACCVQDLRHAVPSKK